MRTLSYEETNAVSGADLQGAVIGMVDGAATGMAIGGKWGGAGGFIVGGISQLFGLIIPTIMGGVAGLVIGAATDTASVQSLLADYRSTFGPGNVDHGGTIG
ncbi:MULTISPECIES: DUF5862 family protein [Pantoea]|jgi:hypothetical protein|uniref:DUF5862 domain-containing protein n=1 Tax=Pantoea vagans TaxID=470934 RepID=A0ABY3LB06_9GAMM|nr:MULTISPECIES: hypothetical protein [Pantoea]ADO11272.1 hypothetical protein Pvag_3130 [Pantoea vagans C9-1]MBK5016773.1 hypothetical protein [Pantoea sp. S62]PAW34982.1 hypothetical protein CIL06_04340 [Pantoea vagans]PXW20394.1 hypothetical protein BY447_2033 [Pantoea sp. JKS000250]QPG27277.1 hypothetical protein IV493_00045 [Pantoea sp. SM3640]